MHKLHTPVLALLVAATLAAPAAAAFRVRAEGTIAFNAAANPNPVAGLGFGAGDRFSASWVVDLPAGTPAVAPTPGFLGTQTYYVGSVTKGQATIRSADGRLRLAQLPASFGAVLVGDNLTLTDPTLSFLRVDQVSINDAPRVENGALVPVYAVDGPVPADVYLRQLNFGVARAQPFNNVPTLVTSTARPDFAALLASNGPFLSFTFSRGKPTSAGQLGSLPTSTFSVINPVLTIGTVPEPGTWSMLITGFVLTGLALRRRAATPPRASAA